MKCFAVLLAGTLLAVPPAAQDPPPASTLLARLGDQDARPSDARRIVRLLAGHDAATRVQLAVALARRAADALRDYQRERARVATAFAREVPKAQRARLGRGGEAKVDTLREQALAHSRAADLTEQRIRAEVDPRLAELRELLLPGADEVLAGDAALAEAVADLRKLLNAARSWCDLHDQVVAALAEDEQGKPLLAAHKPPPPPPGYGAVDDDLTLLCLQGLPLPAHDQKALAANAALAGTVDAEELSGTLELNRIRIVLGLGALAFDEKLGVAARDHSTDMQRLRFFAHESPVPGKRTPGERAARAGTSAGAENIANGHDTGLGAIRAWWYSPGHHQNMLGGHARTGLGRCDQLWTQMFGG